MINSNKAILSRLKRKGYNVFVGRLDDKEIDFAAEKRNEKIYVQVCYKLLDQSTADREFDPLLLLKQTLEIQHFIIYFVIRTLYYPNPPIPITRRVIGIPIHLLYNKYSGWILLSQIGG